MAPALSSSSSSSLYTLPPKSPTTPLFQPSISLQINTQLPRFNHKANITLTAIKCLNPASNSTSPLTLSSSTNGQRQWAVVVKPPPPQHAGSRAGVVDYYVQILTRVLGSEKDAQGCIYNASCDVEFRFCCDLDEEASQELARLSEVISVKPDPVFSSAQKDYNYSEPNGESSSNNNIFPTLFTRSTKHWLVLVEMPDSRVINRAQLVDYYTEILTKVLGNEKDAQMCIYHVSLQHDYGFCCELDDECAKELAGVPGVISVMPDKNANSDDKDYAGSNLDNSSNSGYSSTNQPTNIKTKKLFVTGLSFYTSEKTLREAFEGFGELVEVKIIMDKISKRSKGFAFIEYTTEEAAAAALREMNGKIINGWMIVVDVAKTKPPKYSRGQLRPESR